MVEARAVHRKGLKTRIRSGFPACHRAWRRHILECLEALGIFRVHEPLSKLGVFGQKGRVKFVDKKIAPAIRGATLRQCQGQFRRHESASRLASGGLPALRCAAPRQDGQAKA